MKNLSRMLDCRHTERVYTFQENFIHKRNTLSTYFLYDYYANTEIYSLKFYVSLTIHNVNSS